MLRNQFVGSSKITKRMVCSRQKQFGLTDHARQACFEQYRRNGADRCAALVDVGSNGDIKGSLLASCRSGQRKLFANVVDVSTDEFVVSEITSKLKRDGMARQISGNGFPEGSHTGHHRLQDAPGTWN